MTFNRFSLNHEIIFCLFAGLVIALIYGQTLNYDFLNFDDTLYVTKNPQIQKGLSFEGIKWAFSFAEKEDLYWHPLTWLAHMADVSMFGSRPGLHHLMNMLWHVLNTCLLFLLLHRTTRMFWPSALTALLFAVHPINVDTVAWIAQRKTLLSTFFWLLSMIGYAFYVRKPSLLRYLLVALIFCAGIMAKPVLISLPFIFLLLDFWPLERIKLKNTDSMNPATAVTVQQTLPKIILEKIPFICIALFATMMVTKSIGSKMIIPFSMVPFSLRIENYLVSHFAYLKQLFWPSGLTIYYPFPQSIPNWQVAISAIILLVISTYLLFKFSKKKKYIIVGWFWFLGTLVPVSGLIQAGLWPTHADRWAYVPFIGLYIAISWTVNDVIFKRLTTKVSLLLVSIPLLLLGLISWNQTRYWENSITLFSHTLKFTDNNDIAHNNLGLALKEAGKTQEGISHFVTALQINENQTDSLNNLASTLAESGKYQEAILIYKRIVQLDPENYIAYLNMGKTYAKQSDWGNSIASYQEALKIKPDNQLALINLGQTFSEQGDQKKAVYYYRQLLKYQPDNSNLYFDLGMIYAKDNQLDKAEEHYKKVLGIDPRRIEAYLNLGILLGRQNKFDQALNYFAKARSIDPENINILMDMGITEFNRGRKAEAIQYLQDALKIQPENKQIKAMLGKLRTASSPPAN